MDVAEMMCARAHKLGI